MYVNVDELCYAPIHDRGRQTTRGAWRTTMTNIQGSRPTARVEKRAATVADMIEQIATDPTISKRKRRDICWALRLAGTALGRQAGELPADPKALRQRLKRVSPAQAGVSQAAWRNMASLVTSAFDLCGVACIAGRKRTPPLACLGDPQGPTARQTPMDAHEPVRRLVFASASGSERCRSDHV